MEKKANQADNQKRQAAGNCGANCNKCRGECSQQAQHNGPHKCNSGHSW